MVLTRSSSIFSVNYHCQRTIWRITINKRVGDDQSPLLSINFTLTIIIWCNMLIHCARPRHGISSEPKHFPIPTFIYIRRGVNIFIYMKAAQVNIILLMIHYFYFYILVILNHFSTIITEQWLVLIVNSHLFTPLLFPFPYQNETSQFYELKQGKCLSKQVSDVLVGTYPFD